MHIDKAYVKNYVYYLPMWFQNSCCEEFVMTSAFDRPSTGLRQAQADKLTNSLKHIEIDKAYMKTYVCYLPMWFQKFLLRPTCNDVCLRQAFDRLRLTYLITILKHIGT